MIKPYKTLNKRALTSLISKRIKHSIHCAHIENVMSLFMDEFIAALEKGQVLNMPNFCAFKLEKSKPRKFYNVQERRFAVSSGKYLIKIKISKPLRDKIVENIDVVKTFLAGDKADE